MALAENMIGPHDGGGRMLIPAFMQALGGRRYRKCFEWCAGPGYIGKALLGAGICSDLVLGEINPAAALEAQRNLAGMPARVYVSDNMKDIPEADFDLVVGNPPFYENIQESHPMGKLRYDRRPSDRGWKTHREFYSQIADFLTPDAELWIAEMEPTSREVVLFGKVYDKRDRVPLLDFAEMAGRGGLEIAGIRYFDMAGLNLALLKFVRASDGTS